MNNKPTFYVILGVLLIISGVSVRGGDSDSFVNSSSDSFVNSNEAANPVDIKSASSTTNSFANSSASSSIGYRVVKVVDGDTLHVNIEGTVEKIRLIGINTPETVDPRRSVECFGKDASNKAKELLSNQYVTVQPDASQQNIDKYGRLLRYVFLQDGTNFNLKMIQEGFAYEYTYKAPYKYQAEFKQAQIDAKQNNRGLWGALCYIKK